MAGRPARTSRGRACRPRGRRPAQTTIRPLVTASAPETILRIGGLTPLTTVDFPGELAAVIYCRGCPWRCSYCHNAHLVETDGDVVDWDQVLAFLENRRGLLDAVVFSGGEPTAQAALTVAIEAVRGLGFKVGLHTGGPYPDRLGRLIPLVDWIGLDIKALPEDYPSVTGRPGSGVPAWESLRLLLAADVELEVRTTPPPGLDDDAYLDRLSRALAKEGVTDWVLQQCRSEHMLAPARSTPRQLHAERPANLGGTPRLRIR
jgi:pyruvate formate lyase activating enzyme